MANIIGDRMNYFKNKHLLYYAYFKTCMEFSYKNILCDKHILVKDLLGENNNIADLINNEIDCLNYKIRYKFKLRYEQNIEIIKAEEYMLLRGHDVFEHLVDFLINDNKFIKGSYIRKLAYEMIIPKTFEKQIKE